MNIDVAQRILRKAKSPLAAALFPLCHFYPTRNIALIAIRRLEGGEFWSTTLRRYLKQSYEVEVGHYTYGPCLTPGRVPRGTRFGNYCSIADGLSIFRRNHPVDRISQNAIFYNSILGLVENDTIESDEENPLEVGHDVWIGYGTTITPSCKKIGNGAIIAAGSVVTKDVPAYSINAGIPAKPLRERFSPEIQNTLESSKWWEKHITDLPLDQSLFFEKLDQEGAKRLLNFIEEQA